MATCEWFDCAQLATHTVAISFPDSSNETSKVCRRHDRVLKIQVVGSRPKAQPKTAEPATVQVFCNECETKLDEAPSLPAEQRQSCPACGSLSRRFNVSISATLNVRRSVRARGKSPGKGGWMVDVCAGDDYTRILEAWSKRTLTLDRVGNRYAETLELHDGTKLHSTAKLTDHRD